MIQAAIPKTRKYISLSPLVQYPKEGVQWSKVFGRAAPLEVEIGFGLGDFLIRTARERPQHNFLGLDNSWLSVKKTLRKINQEQISNIRVMHVDAKVVFERLIEPRTVSFIYSLFPCPWPKSRHEKYRLHTSDFLRILNNRLNNEIGRAHV